jgi:uncharacterized protein YkwD
VAAPRIAKRLARGALLLSAIAFPALVSTALAAATAGSLRAHAASSCANTNLTPQPDNLGLVRAAVLCLIDQEREAHGEPALQPNAKLTRAAQGHSEDMASEDYFSHVSPNGETPLDRMRASGYLYSSRVGYEVGENIAWGTLWLASPQSIVNAWMASPGHRANILDARYRETGVGVAPHPPASMAGGQAGGIYTQDFGTILTTGNAARNASGRAGQSNAGHGGAGDRAGPHAHRRALRKHGHRHHHRRRHRRHHRRRRHHRKRHRHAHPS